MPTRSKGKITFASSGHGTSVHLSGELFKRMAGIEMMHVPYRGAGPAINDLIPGRVDVMFNDIGAVLPLIQGEKLRGLAVTTRKAHAGGAGLPPIAEVGVPGFDVSSWYALFAPAKTPAADRPQDARRQRSPRSPTRHQDAARAARRAVVGSTPAELGRVLKRRNGQMGAGHQGGRNQGRRVA